MTARCHAPATCLAAGVSGAEAGEGIGSPAIAQFRSGSERMRHGLAWMALAPFRRPLESQGPETATGGPRLLLLGPVVAIGERLAVADERGIDLGLALAAAGEAAAIAVRPRDGAGDIAARQHVGEHTARLSPTGDIAAAPIAAGLAVFGRVYALEPQFLTSESEGIAVDRLGCTGQDFGSPQPILQNRAGHRQKADEAERHDEIDRATDAPPAKWAMTIRPDSETRHQH